MLKARSTTPALQPLDAQTFWQWGRERGGGFGFPTPTQQGNASQLIAGATWVRTLRLSSDLPLLRLFSTASPLRPPPPPPPVAVGREGPALRCRERGPDCWALFEMKEGFQKSPLTQVWWSIGQHSPKAGPCQEDAWFLVGPIPAAPPPHSGPSREKGHPTQ